jgi:hypothetical protein
MPHGPQDGEPSPEGLPTVSSCTHSPVRKAQQTGRQFALPAIIRRGLSNLEPMLPKIEAPLVFMPGVLPLRELGG